MPFDSQPGRPPGQEGALLAFLAAIRAHPWIVALITVTTVAATVAFLVLRSPEYEATANVLVEPVSAEDQTLTGLPVVRDTGDPVRTVQTAAGLIESPAVADLAARRLGGTWTGERILEEAIDVAPQGESNILAVTATHTSATGSARIANEFAQAALDLRARKLRREARAVLADLEARASATPAADPGTRASLTARADQIRSVIERGDPTLLLTQPAIPPTAASGPPEPVLVLLSVLAGLALGSGTAVMLELLTRRVRDEEEAVATYPLAVLARIPNLPPRARRGPREATWFMPPAVREPFRTLALQLEQTTRRDAAFMITSPTRGDGKTTSAINLGVTLASSGTATVIVDFDLRNPQVGRALRIDGGPGLAELVRPPEDVEGLLVRPFELSTLRILPVSLGNEDGALGEAALAILPELLQRLRRLADHRIVVDTAPLGEVGDALRLATVVDEIIAVIRPGNTARRELEVMRELLERIDRAPAGYIVVGAADAPTGDYYGTGMEAARLVGGSAPSAGRRDASAPPDSEAAETRPAG